MGLSIPVAAGSADGEAARLAASEEAEAGVKAAPKAKKRNRKKQGTPVSLRRPPVSTQRLD